MNTRKGRLGKLPVLTFGLVILVLLALAGVRLETHAAALPAHDWNKQSLKQIKIPTGDSLTFAVLGDNRSNPSIFEKVLKQMDHDSSLTFAIDVGDLVEGGTVQNFRNFLDQVRQNLHLPLLTVIGNHDLEKDWSARPYRRIFGPDHYSFQIKGNDFIVVNDVENYKHGPSVGEVQWRWLEQELQKSQAYKTRVIFLHVPLFDPSGGAQYNSLLGETGRRLAILFRRYHVTHVFAGHIHSYFSGNWDGVPYTITGGAGAPLQGTDPEHFFYHFLKVTLKDGEVDIKVRRLAEKGPS
jgi:3',5'-cyclic AMP phosphodiesterase CpdA